MATWITHLRIAENLLNLLPNLDPGLFAVGNIAPDSGIPDEKWENFTPPPWVTHFGSEGNSNRPLADLEFYRRYLLPLRGKDNPEFVSFRLGYFFHILTDNMWSSKIGNPTQEKYEEQFAAEKDFIWEVKKDWYGLDFIYVRDHPESLFWRVFLSTRADTGGLEFLPLEAVRQRVAYIQQDYQRTDDGVQRAYHRPYIYLSKAEMDAFVEESTSLISRIYQYLWIDHGTTDNCFSALELRN